MAETDNVEKSKALNKIRAFDLVTEGLLSLDAYQLTHDKSQLSKANTALGNAMKTLEQNELLYSRAKYFQTIVKYLQGSGSKETFDELKQPDSDKPSHKYSAYDAELSYNAGAAYYSDRKYDKSAEYFKSARDAKAASPEVRLLAGAGIALSLAKKAHILRVLLLSLELFWELVVNFFRRLVGARHVERALSRKARKLIVQALTEISSRRPQDPKETTTSQPGGLRGAT